MLGKANLSEFGNFRGRDSVSGWSGVGAQCRNPHVLDRSPNGSSSGCAVAVSASMLLYLSHSLAITCTCRYDEIKGTQDQDLFSG